MNYWIAAAAHMVSSGIHQRQQMKCDEWCDECGSVNIEVEIAVRVAVGILMNISLDIAAKAAVGSPSLLRALT